MKTNMKKLSQFIVSLLLIVCLLAAFSPGANAVYTTLPTTSDVGQYNKFTNITTATTTTVKSGSGVLDRIIVNTGGASSVWVAYDNTAGSGTKIASGSSATQIVLGYNCRFGTGLTIVTVTGTPADITVIYR